MGSIIFQWSFNFGACLRIPELGFYWGVLYRVCLDVLIEGCCGSGQYNFLDRMLQLDANTAQDQSYVLFITLVNITYQSRDHLQPIHFWDSSPGQVLYIPLFLIFFFSFLPAVLLNFLSCSACILQTSINLTIF